MKESMIYQIGKTIGDLNRSKIKLPIIKLNSNELPFPHSPAVNKALKEYNSKRFLYYPEENDYLLREKIAQVSGINVDNILITAGSSEAISIAITAFTKYDAEVLIPAHAFQLYQICTKQQNRQAVLIPETSTWEQNLQRTLDRITSKTQFIFLSNPSNPLGTWIKQNKLEAFIKQIPNAVTILIDEAYFEFMDNTPNYISAISYLNLHKKFLITRTFSKLYGLAGVRIGYVIGQPDTILHLKNYQLPYSVNAFAVELASKVLDNRNYYQECKKKITKIRNFLFTQLSQIGFHSLENSSNFLTFHFGPEAKFVVEELERKHIYVTGLSNYYLPEYIRISIGMMREIQIFLKRFQEIIKRNKHI